MSDQDRISPHNINQTDDENEEKYKFEDFFSGSSTKFSELASKELYGRQ